MREPFPIGADKLQKRTGGLSRSDEKRGFWRVKDGSVEHGWIRRKNTLALGRGGKTFVAREPGKNEKKRCSSF